MAAVGDVCSGGEQAAEDVVAVVGHGAATHTLGLVLHCHVCVDQDSEEHVDEDEEGHEDESPEEEIGSHALVTAGHAALVKVREDGDVPE